MSWAEDCFLEFAHCEHVVDENVLDLMNVLDGMILYMISFGTNLSC
jgi:hypothetical protein